MMDDNALSHPVLAR
jgi:hypothetical protein